LTVPYNIEFLNIMLIFLFLFQVQPIYLDFEHFMLYTIIWLIISLLLLCQ